MDEIQQYRDDIDGDLETLHAKQPPTKRLRGIYRTSRHNISYANADLLWDCLLPLRRMADSLATPGGRVEYDETVVAAALSIEEQLRKLGLYGGFGLGQKIVNLFMKDQWALGRVIDYEGLLHAPLDRIVLAKVPGRRKLAPHWNAWTEVRGEGRDTEPVYEYLAIQRELRELAASEKVTLIRLEQRLWHSGRA
jgi:hypothetical protein